MLIHFFHWFQINIIKLLSFSSVVASITDCCQWCSVIAIWRLQSRLIDYAFAIVCWYPNCIQLYCIMLLASLWFPAWLMWILRWWSIVSRHSWIILECIAHLWMRVHRSIAIFCPIVLMLHHIIIFMYKVFLYSEFLLMFFLVRSLFSATMSCGDPSWWSIWIIFHAFMFVLIVLWSLLCLCWVPELWQGGIDWVVLCFIVDVYLLAFLLNPIIDVNS